jgi:hypothetical protein
MRRFGPAFHPLGQSVTFLRIGCLLCLAGLNGCSNTLAESRDYDAPVRQELARGGAAVIELLLEVDRSGRAVVLDVTGVAPGTRLDDIDIAYELVARTTYPPPRAPADTYQSKTLIDLERLRSEGLLANPQQEASFRDYQDRQFMEDMVPGRPVDQPPLPPGPDHTARN